MKLNKFIIAGLAAVLLAGCGGNTETKPAEQEAAAPTTAAIESNARDVTADVEAYLAKELEAETTESACRDKNISWVCNFKTAEVEDDTVTVTVGAIEVPGGIKAVAVAYKNFLNADGSPVSDASKLRVSTGFDSVIGDLH